MADDRRDDPDNQLRLIAKGLCPAHNGDTRAQQCHAGNGQNAYQPLADRHWPDDAGRCGAETRMREGDPGLLFEQLSRLGGGGRQAAFPPDLLLGALPRILYGGLNESDL
jgi:hypothetical protein